MTLITLALVTPLVPLLTIYLFVRSRPTGWLQWFLNFVIAGSVILILHVIGTWAFVSYYLRYVFVLLFLALAVYRFMRLRHAKAVGLAETGSPSRTRTVVKTICAVIVAWLAVLAYIGHIAPANTVDLAFPLHNGTYCIIQGGRNFVTNPFHNFVDSEFAVDIVKLNRFGNRATGLGPRDAESYEIFGELVYSPCDGVVIAAVDSVFDNEPPRANSMSPLGNYVMIACDEAQVILAHLLNSSAVVSAGDSVTRGEMIGRVGNSGYSNEPHLHLQALRLNPQGASPAKPLAVTFGGRFVATNDIVDSR